MLDPPLRANRNLYSFHSHALAGVTSHWSLESGIVFGLSHAFTCRARSSTTHLATADAVRAMPIESVARVSRRARMTLRTCCLERLCIEHCAGTRVLVESVSERLELSNSEERQ